ncbi:MAG: hypothetical protein N2491_05150 [Negativicutes bacterium]|nr:hypothetical protein [Negativicutes bacterium]
MVIDTVSTLALFCARCGKTALHDISHFTLRQAGKRLVCGCGQLQAVVSGASDRQYLLSVPCVVCETSHVIAIMAKMLGKPGIQKLYCPQETVELGFFGGRQEVEQTITAHRREIDRLLREVENEEFVDNPQVMFEIINIVHDIAEKGRIYCRCGHTLIKADILPDAIEVSCLYCGGAQSIPARTERDLEWARLADTIEIPGGRKKRRKH